MILFLKCVNTCHSHVFLEEFKYTVKEGKIRRYINDGLDISSDGSDGSDKNASDKRID